MSSFELSQKDDSRAHSADSLKAYSKLRVSNMGQYSGFYF